MRWAGAPRALSPTRLLAAGVVGGTCPFSARSFCAGGKVCRSLCLRAGWPFAWRCWARPHGPASFIGRGPRRPPSDWPGCLPARRM
jgi:hypothetical protein